MCWHSDQDVNLLEELFEVFLEVLEELIGLPVAGRDDLYFDDIVDEIDAAIFPRTLIRSRLRTDGECSETAINSSRICFIFSASISRPSLYFRRR
jgi:hypothetical protein